jgi:cytochrome c-type protein NapC
MANRVWDKLEKNYSVTCRSCHEFRDMDLSEQDRMARKRHNAAADGGETCIECHKGIAHEEPDDPSLDL